MSEWSNKVVDLPSVLTDKVTKEGSLGSCGNLTFELFDNENSVVRLDEETNQLFVESSDPADEGQY